MFPETQQATPDLPTWEIRLLCSRAIAVQGTC